MIEVSVKEARQRFRELLDRVEQGEEIIVLRRGRPTALLCPLQRKAKRLPPLDNFRNAIGRAGTPSATLLRKERDER